MIPGDPQRPRQQGTRRAGRCGSGSGVFALGLSAEAVEEELAGAGKGAPGLRGDSVESIGVVKVQRWSG